MKGMRALGICAAALVATPLASSASIAARTAPAAAKPVTIAVTARDFSFTLSKKTAPAGKVTFTVKNTGKSDHSFQISDKKTPVLAPGKSATLVVTFAKAGSFPYSSAVAGDAAKGMKGMFATTASTTAGGYAAGKLVFTSIGCGTCHTFTAAGTKGALGPNLDASRVSREAILTRVTGGEGTMPSYAGQLSPKQIEDVADFVFHSRPA